MSGRRFVKRPIVADVGVSGRRFMKRPTVADAGVSEIPKAVTSPRTPNPKCREPWVKTRPEGAARYQPRAKRSGAAAKRRPG